MSAESDGDDLSDGKLSLLSQGHTDIALEIRHQKKWMRTIAFYVLGVVCLAYLVTLLCFLNNFICSPPGFLMAKETPTHLYVLVGMTIVIMAAIPLSLALTLIKMTTEASDSKDERGVLTTPHFEFIKAIFEGWKSVFGKSEK
ncbi:MAG: hypothetical protein M0P19_14190 [Nevskia sp.]|nr:hypothetical protein [Nevskia sp.]MCK9386732.1 hypothetical protein [Nevskia sp.]